LKTLGGIHETRQKKLFKHPTGPPGRVPTIFLLFFVVGFQASVKPRKPSKK